MAAAENEVFQLEEGQQVGCYHCGGNETYRRGEAFLAGPGHTPYDGNANYICRAHLDADAVVYPPEDSH